MIGHWNWVVVSFWTGLVMLIVALALPPAVIRRSWRRFGFSLVLAVFGVILPVGVFFLSAAAFAPEWKSGHSWIDSLEYGKNALAPLVLWATAALYAYELSTPERRTRTWMLAGIVMGAFVSLVCLALGLWRIPLWQGDGSARTLQWGFLIPGYVAVWYGVRAVQILRAGALRWTAILYTFLGSIPFWIYSVILARQHFAGLPEDPPDCFVVTAAARGHVRLVGSWPTIDRRGDALALNRQLVAFWRLEDRLRRTTPGFHAALRHRYEIWGPRLARRVRSRWAADLVYCALKPLELCARALLAIDLHRREL
jgi:hypothetical protein